ncbi:hypothetical protein GGF32_009860 [Allomyces javanicus]|nr:hypothetical protein GGF32_009860 [Allomyces javanicus]
MATDGPAAAPSVGDPAAPAAVANDHANGDPAATTDHAAKQPAPNGNGHADDHAGDHASSDANASGTVTNRTAALGAIDFLPVRVVLLVDRAQHDIYEVDATNPKVLIHKPPRARGNESAFKKIYMDHISVLDVARDTLIKHCQLEEQLAMLLKGFNAAIYTVNTRDPETHVNGLLILALRLLDRLLARAPPLRLSYVFLGVTDTQCIQLDTEKPLQLPFLLDHLDDLFEDAPTVAYLIDKLEAKHAVPTMLMIRLETADAASPDPIACTLTLADLAWMYDAPNAACAPMLPISLAKMQTMVTALAQRPIGARIETGESYLTALAATHLNGNCRTQWLLRADLAHPAVAPVLQLGASLRLIKTAVSAPARAGLAGVARRRVEELESALSRAADRHAQADADRTALEAKVTAGIAYVRRLNATAEFWQAAEEAARTRAAEQAGTARELRVALADARAEVVSEQVARKHCEMEVARLRREVARLEAGQRDAEHDRATTDVATRILTNEATCLRTAVDDAVSDARFAKRHAADLQAVLDSVAEERDAAVARATQWAETAKRYRGKARRANETVAELAATVTDFEAAVGKLQADCDKEHAARTLAESDRDTALAECIKLARDLMQAERAANAARAEAEVARAAAAEGGIDPETEAAYVALGERAMEIQAALEAEQTQVADLVAALEDANAQTAEVEARAREEVEKEKARREQAEKELERANAQVHVLSVSRDDLHAKVERLEHQLERQVLRADAAVAGEQVRAAAIEQERAAVEAAAEARDATVHARAELARELDEVRLAAARRETELVQEMETVQAQVRSRALELETVRQDRDRQARRAADLAAVAETAEAAARAALDQVRDLEARVADATAAVRAAERAAAAAQSDLDAERRRSAAAAAELDNVAAQCAAVTADRDALVDAVAHVQDKYVQQCAVTRAAHEETRAARARARDEQLDLRAELQTAQTDLATVRAQLEDAEARAAAAEAIPSVRPVTAVVDHAHTRELTRARTLLQERTAALDAARAALAAAEADRDAARDDLVQIENERDALRTELTRARVTADQARRSAAATADRARRELERVRADLATAMRERDDVQAALHTATAAAADVVAAQTENARLRRAQADLEARLRRLEKDLEVKETEIANLHEEAAAATATAAAGVPGAGVDEQVLARTRADLAQRAADLRVAEADRRRLQLEIDERNRQVEELAAHVQVLQEELQRTAEHRAPISKPSLARMQNTLLDTTRENRMLKDQNAELAQRAELAAAAAAAAALAAPAAASDEMDVAAMPPPAAVPARSRGRAAKRPLVLDDTTDEDAAGDVAGHKRAARGRNAARPASAPSPARLVLDSVVIEPMRRTPTPPVVPPPPPAAKRTRAAARPAVVESETDDDEDDDKDEEEVVVDVVDAEPLDEDENEDEDENPPPPPLAPPARGGRKRAGAAATKAAPAARSRKGAAASKAAAAAQEPSANDTDAPTEPAAKPARKPRGKGKSKAAAAAAAATDNDEEPAYTGSVPPPPSTPPPSSQPGAGVFASPDMSMTSTASRPGTVKRRRLNAPAARPIQVVSTPAKVTSDRESKLRNTLQFLTAEPAAGASGTK